MNEGEKGTLSERWRERKKVAFEEKNKKAGLEQVYILLREGGREGGLWRWNEGKVVKSNWQSLGVKRTN
jgi:hypothetical protein